MVFSNISPENKVAFFLVLDEYFESRGYPNRESPVVVVVEEPESIVPEPSPSPASRFVSPVRAYGSRSSTHSSESISSSSLRPSASIANPPTRPSLPTRKSTNGSESSLVSVRRAGDIDTSSFGGMFNSVRNSSKNKRANSGPVTITKKISTTYGPPPIRRTTTAEREEEESSAGEWGEALYEYRSKDAEDLELEAQQKVLVVERTSPDWWTGESNGKRGLFPATYVKLL